MKPGTRLPPSWSPRLLGGGGGAQPSQGNREEKKGRVVPRVSLSHPVGDGPSAQRCLQQSKGPTGMLGEEG